MRFQVALEWQRATRILSRGVKLDVIAMTAGPPYLPFSQRAGLEPVPPQLKLGEVSEKLRRVLNYYIDLEIDRHTRSGYERGYFDDDWERVTMDLQVLFFGRDSSDYENSPYDWKQTLKQFVRSKNIGELFDLIEFLAMHPKCSGEMKSELAEAFTLARAAYRLIDQQIIAIGTEEQAAAFVDALENAQAHHAKAARNHLVAAGLALRNSEWASSVRESIHAVEAMAIRLVPGTTTLGPALSSLEKQGHLHGSLKAAFGALYGYASDEEGIRHSLVFKEEAQVDEADALFMLGACASFVTYLISRSS